MEKMETLLFGVQVILGLYRDNGKENGNYYLILNLSNRLQQAQACSIRRNSLAPKINFELAAGSLVGLQNF